MKKNAALAYLRQICCSGLGSDVAISEFLRSVCYAIPSNSNTFSQRDENLRPTYFIPGFDMGEMAKSFPHIVTDFNTSKRRNRTLEWFQQHPAISDPRVMDDRFYETDLYTQIFQPFDMHHVLWAPLRLDNKLNGLLCLHRSKNQKSFDDKDKALLLHFISYVSFAFSVVEAPETTFNEQGDSGLLIMNKCGDILYRSAKAERLLMLASSPRISIDTRENDRLLSKLKQVCRNLQAIYQGQTAAPPLLIHVGPNGRFTFRAYWLNGQGHWDMDGFIGVMIEHRESLKLTLLRALQAVPLSPTQKVVAMLLAEDVSFEHIGRHLHIKPSTVKDHVGKIYDKLDIHQREALLPKLLGMKS